VCDLGSRRLRALPEGADVLSREGVQLEDVADLRQILGGRVRDVEPEGLAARELLLQLVEIDIRRGRSVGLHECPRHARMFAAARATLPVSPPGRS
jgi:hypothetical protein